MDLNTPVVTMCLEGLNAEMAGQRDEAHAQYTRAWTARTDAYDACVAAHYLARTQENPADTLAWNLEALAQAALLVGDERVISFLPSLHLNVGHSYEMLGELAKARAHYVLADGAASVVSDGRYGAMLREGIAAGQRRMSAEASS